MQPLEGTLVLAAGGMADRPLCRFLATLGAQVRGGEPEESSVAEADFLIDDFGIERLADRGITRALLETWNPALVHVSVTPFGSGGPRARWRGGELVVSAMGGTLGLTGEPGEAPVKEALDACTFHADMAAAAGAMAAWYSLARSGRGQHVDVSIQEVAFSRNVSGVLAWQFDRRKVVRAGGFLTYGKARVRCIWQLADGWCFHSLMSGRFGAPANQALSEWIDEAGLDNPLREVDWLRYDRSTLPAARRAEWERAIDGFFRTRTRDEIRGEGRRRGINACVVEAPVDVPADPHLQARGFWIEEAGCKVPGRFASLCASASDATSPRADPPEPVPVATRLGNSIGPDSKRQDSRGGPLAGMRVLDFSWALVGSITTKILGDLGADVIKVESRARPCLSRLDVQVAASRPGELDDKPWFAHLNTSKRSLSLDLKKPESREILERLVTWADAVVENFSPGTMDRLGLGYADLAAANRGLVMASGSVYGQSGPLASEWGVDGTGGALSGRTWLTGRRDGNPVIPGAVPYGDVIVPYVMAACVIASLVRRQRDGQGCHIDASMYEICAQQMAPAIIAAQRGADLRRDGNRDPNVYRQNVYPAAGDDRWVAISLFDAVDEARLRQLTGDEPIGQWTAARDAHEIVAQLQDNGIAAGVVQDIEDIFERDAALLARGALVELPHPKLGAFGHVRTPLTFSGDRVTPFRAPAIGEHNREIALGVAGLSAARYRALEAELN